MKQRINERFRIIKLLGDGIERYARLGRAKNGKSGGTMVFSMVAEVENADSLQ
ncbi:MAG: hypothetical protein MJE77_43590 [Proteobacteria bacterium]|nr:hypothetical protein [Pseudomonadota bacterium]